MQTTLFGVPPPKKSSFVACPACGKDVPAILLNMHLDTVCLADDQPPAKRRKLDKAEAPERVGSSFHQCPCCEAHVPATLLNHHLDVECGRPATVKPDGADTLVVAKPVTLDDIPAYDEPDPEESDLCSDAPVMRLLSTPRVMAPKGTEFTGQMMVENFCTEEEEAGLAAALRASLPWSPAERNGVRRVLYYGVVTDVVKRVTILPGPPLPHFVSFLVERLRTVPILKDFNANQLAINDYHREAGDYIAAHMDDRQLSGLYIVNLSLLSDCYMTFSHEGTGAANRVLLPRRSLQIMTGNSRFNFRHAIQNEDLLGPRRISLTFREAGQPTSRKTRKK